MIIEGRTDLSPAQSLVATLSPLSQTMSTHSNNVKSTTFSLKYYYLENVIWRQMYNVTNTANAFSTVLAKLKLHSFQLFANKSVVMCRWSGLTIAECLNFF